MTRRFRENTEVSYAVRPGVVCRYLGQLCLIAAVLTCVPGLFAVACGDYQSCSAYFIIALALAVVGIPATRWLRPTRQIQRNEASVIAALIFPLAALAMSVPYIDAGLSFPDAIFESVSGVTTTGLTTIPQIDECSRTILFSRAWQQWYGGLGFVILSLAIMAHPGGETRDLAPPDPIRDDLLGSTRMHARRVIVVYTALTLVGFAGLWASGLSWFDAVAHSLSAVSTGGFSTFNNSIAGFPSYFPRLMTIGLCTSCAISLPLYWHLVHRERNFHLAELQLIVIIALGAASTLLLTAIWMHAGESFGDTAPSAVLTVFSAQTTSGFAPTRISELDAASKLVLIASMAIGGGTMSTAGGFKVLRLIILFRVLQSILIRSAIPRHAVHEPHLAGHRMEGNEIQTALMIVILFGLVVVASWLPFLLAGFAPLDSLFEVVSATGTVGLSTGITSPSLPDVLKGVLCVDMLMGRLECIALLVVVFPRTWIGKRVQTS